MVATCGGVFFGVAPLAALAAGVVWLIVFVALPLRLGRIDRGRHRAAGLLRSPRLPDVRRAPRRRRAPTAILFLHRANLVRLRAGTGRVASPLWRPSARSRGLAFTCGRGYPARACARDSSWSSSLSRGWCTPGALAAGWCGGSTESAGDRPDLVTGQQVHAVVAIPSDGVDTFPGGGRPDGRRHRIDQCLVAGTGPDTIPRFDQATFGAATCTDISFGLPGSGAAYAAGGAGGGFQRVASDVSVGGLGSVYKKYLVYYAGPSVQANVCGTGSRDFTSGGPTRSSGCGSARTFPATPSLHTSSSTHWAPFPTATGRTRAREMPATLATPRVTSSIRMPRAGRSRR